MSALKDIRRRFVAKRCFVCVSMWLVTLPAFVAASDVLELAGSADPDSPPVCGGRVNSTRGYIQTPNFPDRFPTPIFCRWVIYAPASHRIIVYFTQYYLRESFHAAEYDMYAGPNFYVGKTDLGEISFESEVTSLTVYKQYLVLTFAVETIGNIHLRVDEFLLDVYGFNITYETVDAAELPRPDACSVFQCSFLGNCLATSNFEKYECHCFPNFYGRECQLGPYCDPKIGMNMCRNGGKCRYYFGSLVNTCECPAAYEGAQCENRRANQVDLVCENLGCKQKCTRLNNATSVACDCLDGFRLLEDNKTCVEKGRMRYYGQIRLDLNSLAEDYTDTGVLTTICKNFSGVLTDKVSTYLSSSIQEFTNFTLIQLRHHADFLYVDFYFIGEKSERDQIWMIMQYMIYKLDVCGFRTDSTYLVFDQQAALHALSVRSQEKTPVVEGGLLSLVCKARGSRKLSFVWRKDGNKINVHLTNRNVWENRIPSSDGEKHISILNIEKAHRFDEGTYECVASDWNETLAVSTHVHVIPVPILEVLPGASTVRRGRAVEIACRSRDDERHEFAYQWLRDGVGLASAGANGEIVMDVFPTGSRLRLQSSQKSAVYACVIKSQAGQSSANSTVTIFNESTPTCLPSQYGGVAWQHTRDNQLDVRLCPRQNVEGMASRLCKCTPDACRWKKPNFLLCTSIPLDALNQKLTKLKMGYQVDRMEHILRKLEAFLQHEIDKTDFALTGDLQTSLQMLNDIHEYIRQFMRSVKKQHLYRVILDLWIRVLDMTEDVASDEERKHLRVMEYTMQLIQSLRKDAQVMIDTSRLDFTYHSKYFNITVGEYNECFHGTRDFPSGLNDVQISLLGKNCTTSRKSEIVHMVSVTYSGMANLAPYFQDWDNPTLFVGPSLSPYQYHDSTRAVLIEYSVRPDTTLPVGATKTVVANGPPCWVWDFQTFPRGEWSSDGCTLVSINWTSIVCKCVLPGHFKVSKSLTVAIRDAEEAPQRPKTSMVILVCGVISIFGFAIVLITHSCGWRKVNGDSRVITLNLSLIMIATCALIVGGFTRTDLLVLCQAVKLLLFVLFLAALSFMLAESVRLYTKSVVLEARTRPILTDMGLGWGIPILAGVPVAVAGGYLGYSQQSEQFCWLAVGEWEMFAFCVPAGMIALIYVVIMSLNLRNALCKAPPYVTRADKRKFVHFACRSLLTMVYLMSAIVTSLVFVYNTRVLFEYLFGSALVAAAVIYLLLSPLCNMKTDRPDGSKNGALLDVIKPQELLPSDSTLSFKSFHKSASRTSREIEMLMDETRQRDRQKYTRERKEQLMALLGTSSSSEDSKGSHATRASTATSNEDDVFESESSASTAKAAAAAAAASAGAAASTRSPGEKPKKAGRHSVNRSCSCTNCGTSFPFKPERVRSFIIDDTQRRLPDRRSSVPALPRTSVSFTKGASAGRPGAQPSHSSLRRKSVPNPFPELGGEVLSSISEPLSESSLEADDRKPKRATLKQEDRLLMRQLLDLRAQIHALRGMHSCHSVSANLSSYTDHRPLVHHSDGQWASTVSLDHVISGPQMTSRDYDVISDPRTDSPITMRELLYSFNEASGASPGGKFGSVGLPIQSLNRKQSLPVEPVNFYWD